MKVWWQDPAPHDACEPAELAARSDWLMARWEDALDVATDDGSWGMPRAFREVVRAYEERGVPLGPPSAFLPPELAAVYRLRRFGREEALAAHLEALERMSSPALALVGEEDRLAYERLWERLTVLRRRAAEAEAFLARRGFEISDKGLLRFTAGYGRPSKYGPSAARHVHAHLEPRYRRGWPRDRARNPKALRTHVRALLEPWLGPLPDGVIRQATRRK